MSDNSAKIRLPSRFVRVGQEVPVDVYAKNGLLLLKKGHYVLTDAQRERLVEMAHGDAEEVAVRLERERLDRAAQREKDAEASAPKNPLVEAGFLAGRLEKLLLHGLSVPGLAGRVEELAEGLQALCERFQDGMIAAMFMLPVRSHSFHVATVLAILGRRLGFAPERLHSLVCAGMTMNIAIAPLLNQLSQQTSPLSEEQREALFAHPVLGSAILREAGVSDEHWHLLVQTHHETMSGDGYPQGLSGEEVHQDARLIGLVDQLCELLTLDDGPLPSQTMSALFRGELGEVDPQWLTLLIRELGIYPPGSFVRLASGEIAVVTYRGDKANQPRVAALRKENGPPYADALLRDTRQTAYRVVGSATLADAVVKTAYLAKLWTSRMG